MYDCSSNEKYFMQEVSGVLLLDLGELLDVPDDLGITEGTTHFADVLVDLLDFRSILFWKIEKNVGVHLFLKGTDLFDDILSCFDVVCIDLSDVHDFIEDASAGAGSIEGLCFIDLRDYVLLCVIGNDRVNYL
jgi:hypothetical protein